MENFALSNGDNSCFFFPTHKQFGNSGPETPGGNKTLSWGAWDQKYVHDNTKSFPQDTWCVAMYWIECKCRNEIQAVFNKARYQRDLQKYNTLLPLNVFLFWKSYFSWKCYLY